jgi:signal transduction histidine kinase
VAIFLKKWQIVFRVMSGLARGWIGRQVAAFLSLGITPALSDSLAKRIRITNAASLFGTVVMLATIPVDRVEAPRWMLALDILAALVFISLALLNWRGHSTASRLAFVVVSNLLALSNAIGLGVDCGVDMLFLALVAVPFALFDLAASAPMAIGVLLPIAGFVLAESGVLAHFRSPPANYSAHDYHLYSAVVSLTIVLFALTQMSRANARSEHALRLDIAERQRTERELAESRQASIVAAKMAALGEMSANVAHEVNNPLTAIRLRAQQLGVLAARERLDIPTVLKTAGEIDGTVDRIRRIVAALGFFARQSDEDPLRPESVLSIVNDTVELCAHRFRLRDVDLEVEPIPADLYVDCRGTQISQVLLNLLANAYDAVEQRPIRRVRIATRAGDSEIQIAVTDSGPGVPAEIASRIMEPFFTTKEIGKGTGLGLSLSSGIAAAHGGRLTHDRAASETRFVLTLRRCGGGGRPLHG